MRSCDVHTQSLNILRPLSQENEEGIFVQFFSRSRCCPSNPALYSKYNSKNEQIAVACARHIRSEQKSGAITDIHTFLSASI